MSTKDNTQEVIKRLDGSVLAVIGADASNGFNRAYLVANAIGELRAALTDEYMKPILALQGSKLGFRTDKDKNGGYPIETVRNCLIEAVLLGLQPTGNQFNIIAGNMYPTKEGCGYLLNNWKGLNYEIVCGIPKVNAERTGASVEVAITWTLNNVTKTKTVPFAIKMDQYTTVDAIVGKATRKSRAWLISTISGIEVTDGEVEDVKYTEVYDADDLRLQFDMKKHLMKQEDAANIQRILDNKESQSYKKVKQTLDRY